jgi:hypothetical protein
MTRKWGSRDMMLSYEQQDNVRRRFPKDVELSLDNYLPGKVQADIYEVLPVGKPAFLWFTFFENGHAAFVVTNTQRGYRYEIVKACFDDELAYGTILSGVFTIRSKEDGTPHSFFCANDVVMYKGVDMRHGTNFQRLDTLSRAFGNNEVGNLGPTDGVITIKTTMMSTDFTVAQGHLNTSPYPAYGIRMFNMRDYKSIGILPATTGRSISKDIRSVFLVRANSDPDSYSLFGKRSDTDARYGKEMTNLTNVGLALVPSYSDSVRMNILFRNIRENVSLDYIEESEDEDEFQDINPIKYLIDGAEHKMNCYFSKGCNRWVPESIADGESQISVAPSVKQYPSYINTYANRQKNKSSPRWKNHRGDASGDYENYASSPPRKPIYKPTPSACGTDSPGYRHGTPRQNVKGPQKYGATQHRQYQNGRGNSRASNPRASTHSMHF